MLTRFSQDENAELPGTPRSVEALNRSVRRAPVDSVMHFIMRLVL